MTNNEIELLTLIRSNENPEQALLVAIDVIIGFLNHPEVIESKCSVDSQESV